MKTPVAFAAALSRQVSARTSPTLSQGFGSFHPPPLPSINVISPSPTRELGPFVWPAPAAASTAPAASGQRRQAVSFLARRAEQRDASLAPPRPRVSTAPSLLTISELSTDKVDAAPAPAAPIASTSTPTSTATDSSAWPSLHFATCECETCDPPTSRTYATAETPSVTPTTPSVEAKVASGPAAPRVRPTLRQRATDDPAALRKKALRRVMHRKLKGRSISGSTTPTGSQGELMVPSIMLNGSTVLVESEAAAKARVEGE